MKEKSAKMTKPYYYTVVVLLKCYGQRRGLPVRTSDQLCQEPGQGGPRFPSRLRRVRTAWTPGRSRTWDTTLSILRVRIGTQLVQYQQQVVVNS